MTTLDKLKMYLIAGGEQAGKQAQRLSNDLLANPERIEFVSENIIVLDGNSIEVMVGVNGVSAVSSTPNLSMEYLRAGALILLLPRLFDEGSLPDSFRNKAQRIKQLISQRRNTLEFTDSLPPGLEAEVPPVSTEAPSAKPKRKPRRANSGPSISTEHDEPEAPAAPKPAAETIPRTEQIGKKIPKDRRSISKVDSWIVAFDRIAPEASILVVKIDLLQGNWLVRVKGTLDLRGKKIVRWGIGCCPESETVHEAHSEALRQLLLALGLGDKVEEELSQFDTGELPQTQIAPLSYQEKEPQPRLPM